MTDAEKNKPKPQRMPLTVSNETRHRVKQLAGFHQVRSDEVFASELFAKAVEAEYLNMVKHLSAAAPPAPAKGKGRGKK